MATTDHTSGVTLSDAAWADDIDCAGYAVLSGVAGTNTITATGPATYTYAATRPPVWFIPAATNTGATTINITPSGSAALGAKNIFSGGLALVGGELRSGVAAGLIYDGTQFNLIAAAPRTGSWTPSLGGTATYTNQIGHFIKNGPMVHLFGRLTVNVLGTGSTTTISGAPFAAANISSNQPGSVSAFGSLAVSVLFISCEITNNATTVTFNSATAAGVTSSNAIALFGNSADVTFAISYYTPT